jgi:Holliday junction resolvase RusA-like endonuclease
MPTLKTPFPEKLLQLTVLGIPAPKQSFRFNPKTGGKFTDAKTTGKLNSFIEQVVSSLPKGFIPFDCKLKLVAVFVFPPVKSMKKAILKDIEEGALIYKETRPDLTDNLMKGICDKMTGVVYTDDSRICSIKSDKYYGSVPRTELTFYKLL